LGAKLLLGRSREEKGDVVFIHGLILMVLLLGDDLIILSAVL
jgi:hypothetical protein